MKNIYYQCGTCQKLFEDSEDVVYVSIGAAPECSYYLCKEHFASRVVVSSQKISKEKDLNTSEVTN